MNALVRKTVGRVRSLFARLAAQVTLRDGFAFGGLAAVGYGVWQIHQPTAWIVVGAVVFVLGARR